MSFLIRMMMLMIMMVTPIMMTWLMDEYRSKAPVSGRAPRHTRRKPQVTGEKLYNQLYATFHRGRGGNGL